MPKTKFENFIFTVMMAFIPGYVAYLDPADPLFSDCLPDVSGYEPRRYYYGSHEELMQQRGKYYQLYTGKIVNA